MEPIRFGPEQALFGLYHPNVGGHSKGCVLVCPPLLGEFYRSYQVYDDITNQLAQSGFDSLRFDFRGTGDSANSFHEVGPEDWVNDITAAAQELMELSGNTKVRLVTARLSSLLALKAMQKMHQSVEQLVCWDPVPSGEEYLASLRNTYQKVLQNLTEITRVVQESNVNELMGFRFHIDAVTDIKALQFLALWQALENPPPLQLVCSDPLPDELKQLAEKVFDPGEDCEWLNISERMLFATGISKTLLEATLAE